MIRLFRIIVPFRVAVLLASETLLTFAAFILATYLTMDVDPATYLLYDAGLFRILLVTASILLAIHFQDLYSQLHVKSRVVLLQQLSLAIGATFLLQGMIGYLQPDWKLPLSILGPGSAITLPLLFGWRALFSAYEPRVVSRERVLLVGGGPLLAGLGGYIENHPHLGLQNAGYVRDSAADLPGGQPVAPLSGLREAVETADPRRLVVDMADRGERVPVTDLLELRFAGVGIEDGASAYERIRGRLYLGALQLSDLLATGDLQPREQAVALQQLGNMALAAATLAITLPALALAALALRLSSPGPVFERRWVVGRGGEPFALYRLRCQGAGAAARIVRRLRIDALPELFSVLRGDLSLVGPRPDRPEFAAAIAQQIPFYPQRQMLRPGITGWAQISPARGYDTAAMLEYDLYYLKNMSLALDTFILFHTLKSVLLSPARED